MDSYKILAEKLRSSNFTVVSTGAGISAESGVPTFRGAGGLWKKYRAQDLATPQAFAKDPKLVWEFYDYRKQLIAKVEPNPGHYALAKIEEKSEKFCLITQNIDNLHYLAGSKDIYELHGNIFIAKCTNCTYKTRDLATPLEFNLPKCPECGSLLRPEVVWFGESLPKKILEQAFSFSANCDVMLIIGTSGVVQPAASLPLLAKQNGAFIGEINLEKTPISTIADLTILGKSGEILPKIVELL